MSANDTQVGGTHYRSPFQHWDLAHECDMGAFEYQITKYATRHRFKNGKVDAEKCLHFAKKLHELCVHFGRTPRHRFPTSSRMMEYQAANKLNDAEMQIINATLRWRTADDLYHVISCITRLLLNDYLTGAAEPGPNYINQGDKP